MNLVLVSFLFPSLTFATVVAGTYRSAHGTVKVMPIHDKYRINIMTQYNQFTCEFEGVGIEMDEATLTVKEDDCSLTVDQDDEAGRTLSVKILSGCQQYCGAGATLSIPLARR